MDRVCDLHRALYNAALQERRDAYRVARKSISFLSQCRSLTEIRRDDPEYGALNAQSLQVTIKRVDTAFERFFRRAKAGEAPGYPRFKSKTRFPGFGFKTHGDGFRFKPGDNWKHGRLRLSGIGDMKARGEARTSGRVLSGDILRKVDGWYLSLVVACEPVRQCVGGGRIAVDWGAGQFAVLCRGPGQFEKVVNDRFYLKEQEALIHAQRVLSVAHGGGPLHQRKGARAKLAIRSRRLANRQRNLNHQFTALLVRDNAVIITAAVGLVGSTPKHGEKGSKKKDRPILISKKGGYDAPPESWLSMVRYKAAEAGSHLIYADPRRHSQSKAIADEYATAWALWDLGVKECPVRN